MTVKYSFQKYESETMARASGRSLPISTRQSIEISNFLRGKKLEKAKNILQRVMEKKQAIPYRIYNDNIAHKPGIGPGKYPEKASMHILKLLESVEANAQFKGIDTSKLIVAHISANQAARTLHYGRKRRRKMKRTNIEIVVKEKLDKIKDSKERSEDKK